jgi:hypothetical protein
LVQQGLESPFEEPLEMNRTTICLLLLIACALWVFGCGEELECAAGEEDCVGTQVRVCTADGTWGAPEDCDVGTCMDMGQGPQCMDMGMGDDDDSSADDDDSAN